MVLAQNWPIELVSIDDLDLDLRNVRIPADQADASAIANYLVEATALLDLIRDILRDGYLDNELPVVVAANTRFTVLEGNRRITALKAIKEPTLLGKAAAQVERLKSRWSHGETPTEVRVMVAPSRPAAQPLLARLHTTSPKVGWVREQQAIFYHSQLSATVNVDDLRATYPGATQMLDYIRMGEMRALVRSLKYPDSTLRDFVFAGNLKMTSFEYVYEKSRIQGALGIAFDGDGLLVSKHLTPDQGRAFVYVLGRLRAGTLNTRSPELKVRGTEFAGFVEILAGIVAGGPTPAAKPATTAASSSADSNLGGSEASESTAASSAGQAQGAGTNGPRQAGAAGESPGGGAGSRGPNRGDTLSRLNMDGFDYKGVSAGMRRRVEELRRIDVRDFPNATYDLLRTVLECSIKEHLVAIGKPLRPGSTLGSCVTELAKEWQGDRRLTNLLNPINRSGRMVAAQYSGTADSLNSTNHEPDAFVVDRDVHAGWDKLKPILIALVGT